MAVSRKSDDNRTTADDGTAGNALPPAAPMVETLAEHLTNAGRMTPRQTAALGAQLAMALDVLHGQGIVHGNITPHLVGLTAEHEGTLLERDGEAAAVGYMSPQVAKGAEPTPKDDVWSLGGTLYAALEAQGPFTGTPDEMRAAIIARDPDEPVHAGDMGAALYACLTSDPALRPTASRLARSLTLLARYITDDIGPVFEPEPDAAVEAPSAAALISLPTIALTKPRTGDEDDDEDDPETAARRLLRPSFEDGAMTWGQPTLRIQPPRAVRAAVRPATSTKSRRPVIVGGVLLVVVVVAVAGVALGGGSKKKTTTASANPSVSASGSASPSAAASVAPTTAASVAPLGSDAQPGVPAVANATAVMTEPKIAVGTGTPSTGLVTRDLVVGTGTAAVATDTVSVRYEGSIFATGTVFDASWKSGTTAVPFPLSGVVPGFAAGIVGMKPGGRREIVIPPALGYGAAGTTGIAGTDTIVFVVDLVTTGPAAS